MDKLKRVVAIAKVCHQANKAWCESVKDFSLVDWEQTSEEDRMTCIKAVEDIMDNPYMTAEDVHNVWLKHKLDSGWKYGPVKDAGKKEHPCIVAYKDLDEHQKSKDILIRNIVISLMK